MSSISMVWRKYRDSSWVIVQTKLEKANALELVLDLCAVSSERDRNVAVVLSVAVQRRPDGFRT
jgi:hypothetical protein